MKALLQQPAVPQRLLLLGYVDKHYGVRVHNSPGKGRQAVYTVAASEPTQAELGKPQSAPQFIPAFHDHFMQIYGDLCYRIPDLAMRAIGICDDIVWGRGTAEYRRAVHYGLRQEYAALKAAPQPPQAEQLLQHIAEFGELQNLSPQAERVPMTAAELEDGFNSPSVDVALTDTVESVFTEGARFAERHHGIGAKP